MKIGPQKPAVRKIHAAVWFTALGLALGLLIGTQGWRIALPRLFNPPLSELPVLSVDIAFADYNTLLQKRKDALHSGVIIAAAQDFVPAALRLEGTQTPVRLRLLEGLAQNLGADERWGFEVRTQDGQRVLDMQRFYLQDPSVNNGLYQWAFAESLRREGILTARCRFVRLVLNGDERGIYAVQEGFGDELLLAQGRTPGVIAEFDAALLWQSIAHFGNVQAAYADPISNLSLSDWQYFEVNTFRDAAIVRDPALAAQKEKAVALLRSLQTGERVAGEVFDTAQYGRFLALVDLWGAMEGASLVNLKYYYNVEKGRLEPVSFDANPLGRKGRLSMAATYNDVQIQTAYIREIARLSQPEYLDEMQAALQAEWEQLAQTLRHEFPDLESPWEALRRRQTELRRSLDPVQPVFAYLETESPGALRIDVGNVLNVPVAIVGFEINSALFLPIEAGWIHEETAHLRLESASDVVLRAFDAASSPVVRYMRVDIPLTAIHRLDQEINFNQEPVIQIATRLLGHARDVHMTPVRYGLPAGESK